MVHLKCGSRGRYIGELDIYRSKRGICYRLRASKGRGEGGDKENGGERDDRLGPSPTNSMDEERKQEQG